MTEKKTRKKYDREFIKNTMELLAKGERTQAVLEKDLGLSAGTVARWKRVFANNGISVNPGQGGLHSFEEENARLKRELQVVRQEREILKKAMGVVWRTSP